MIYVNGVKQGSGTELETKIGIALNLIAMNKLSLEEIAIGADLPLEKVKELAEKKSA